MVEGHVSQPTLWGYKFAHEIPFILGYAMKRYTQRN
jgi:hypothetical protein